ncbi:hypothetical protein [Hymenobacter arizonensis]|uniref:SpoIIAA-like n=1 Tax=Hymenobacter arizonensis TaxID=1227077 RepID=A0A1I5XF63_HYMAR|nr:hypothetical protein [Hymenobacter arizonensis]SFQ30456.1 hypothetical protein SAMN04515668_1800 [Hymenobacter arizonensis]
MIITTIPDLSVQHDEALGLLRIEWASGQDMRTFRASFEQILELAQRSQTRHVLLDINSFPDISVYDQVWMGSNWMPELVKLPIERLVLAINRHRVHNQLAIDSLIATARPLIKFDLQFFLTAVPGLHWLSDYSPRLPMLLAEWNAVHGPDLPSASGNLTEPRNFFRPRG